MGHYLDKSLKQYLLDAASDKPAPGGGSVSALAGALAASMGEMAANFTVGKEKFADVQGDIEKSLKKLQLARNKLAILIDEDAKAYSAVTDAQNMPRSTEAEKRERKAALQEALKEAMLVPLNIMRQCLVISNETIVLVEKANPYLITDVGVCAILAEAACAAAKFNVDVNLKYMDESELAQEACVEADTLCQKTMKAREDVQKVIKRKL